MIETKVYFDEIPGKLKRHLVEVGSKVEEMIDLAIKGYTSGDAAVSSQVLTIGKDEDPPEGAIRQLSLDLRIAQQSIAADLRFVGACMKIKDYLELICDRSAPVVKGGLHEMNLPAVEPPIDMTRIAAGGAAMIRMALKAFIERDLDLAYAVLRVDNVVDRIDDHAWKSLLREMHEFPDALEQAVNALIVVKNLARIAEHATNFAEDVSF